MQHRPSCTPTVSGCIRASPPNTDDDRGDARNTSLPDAVATSQAVAGAAVKRCDAAALAEAPATGAGLPPAEWLDSAGRLMLKNMRRSELALWCQQQGALRHPAPADKYRPAVHSRPSMHEPA